MLERVRGHWSAGLAIILVFLLTATNAVGSETRSLKLHFTHTNERAEIVFKRNGRFVREGLERINWILRDWRRDEATEMDPRLLDLLWEVYQASGSRDYIHVISAYRSPATNQMLRSRSSGVADNSQHTRGRAIDFFLPDVPVQRLRDLGLRHHGGGVGFYPRSGSPFVHLDTGSVRHWPRMNRQQLMAVFPDGRTMHVPSDGRPLPGYQQALAAYEARQRSAGSVQIASGSSSPSSSGAASSSASSSSGGGLLAALVRGGRSASSAQQDTQPAQQRPAAASASGQTRPASSSGGPTPPASVGQPAPAPQPETPATILAALPSDRVPLPMSAPRPRAPVGEAAAEVAAVAAPAEDLPFEVREAESEVAALVPPIPMTRPARQAVAEAPVEPVIVAETPAEVESAETLVAEAPAEIDTAETISIMAALAPVSAERPSATAIDDLLASSRHQAEQVALANSELRQSGSDTPAAAVVDTAGRQGVGQDDYIVLAALPGATTQGGQASAGAASLAARQQAADALAIKERAVAAINDNRVAPMPAATSPRQAVISRGGGTDAVAALDSGVRTTAKSARPGPDDVARRARQPEPAPMQATAMRTHWVLDSVSVFHVTSGTRAPSFAGGFGRNAPRTAYADGFRHQGVMRDVRRFNGSTMRVVSIARFQVH